MEPAQIDANQFISDVQKGIKDPSQNLWIHSSSKATESESEAA
jgi:hypothetical protein